MISKIIIEGPDCSGKSTLLERVKNMLRWDAKSLHHKEGNQFSRYLKQYCLNEMTVIDRAHFSEAVYGEMWRGGNPFTKEEMESLNFLAKKDAIVIFACPDIEVLEARYKARDYYQQIKLEELKQCRELFMKYIQYADFHYKSSSYEELDELLKKIQKLLLSVNNNFSLSKSGTSEVTSQDLEIKEMIK